MDELDNEALAAMVIGGQNYCSFVIEGWQHDPNGATPERRREHVTHWREIQARIPALAEAFRRAGVSVG